MFVLSRCVVSVVCDFFRGHCFLYLTFRGIRSRLDGFFLALRLFLAYILVFSAFVRFFVFVILALLFPSLFFLLLSLAVSRPSDMISGG